MVSGSFLSKDLFRPFQCPLDIMKQLFDISRLFDVVDDFTDTYASFRKVADVELGYRGMEGQIDRYYEDVRQTAMNISTRGEISKEEFTRLQGGTAVCIAAHTISSLINILPATTA